MRVYIYFFFFNFLIWRRKIRIIYQTRCFQLLLTRLYVGSSHGENLIPAHKYIQSNIINKLRGEKVFFLFLLFIIIISPPPPTTISLYGYLMSDICYPLAKANGRITHRIMLTRHRTPTLWLADPSFHLSLACGSTNVSFAVKLKRCCCNLTQVKPQFISLKFLSKIKSYIFLWNRNKIAIKNIFWRTKLRVVYVCILCARLEIPRH